ncbi:MAG TPA: SDR family NAD(P)-dependent oxidoreductase [Candidatus Thiothrix moscowensis]|uniref:SDR family NAD(P)-dependent oxidoreductase n=1 Tax=unclassified Thiothrix TaxID=2636184 RepID=UPI0025DC99DC|nr:MULTISPECIES: SDR family NAD(P)-dependent oxidoreductase [unclassified Thiothrix]HRJ51581.1 SDR family NAD(P)-dependent oxidoreductase [Candidatus Thiothrix moscowensis]HRJ91896.1 SDR family NAD(P)-dependent oxidoreductase [Candidatus Thiothrix moscowensis]
MPTPSAVCTPVLPSGQLLSLRNRAAIITSADDGLGIAIAQRLAEAGADLLLCGTNRARLLHTCTQIQDACGVETHILLQEAATPAAADTMIHHAIRHFPHADILVNNACLFPAHPMQGADNTVWQQISKTHLPNIHSASLGLAQHLRHQGKTGVILNILSLATASTLKTIRDHVTIQHVLANTTQAMVAEFTGWDIRCLALAPTRLLRTAVDLSPEVGALMAENPRTRQAFEDYINAMLADKTEQDNETATLALFAVSDMIRFASGSMIPLDGNQPMWH